VFCLVPCMRFLVHLYSGVVRYNHLVIGD